MTKYNFGYKRNDYMTPPELVELALKIKGVEYFVLDVYCTKKNIPALQYFISGRQNGLEKNWEILNWCNPPFDQCDKWVKKAYLEQKKGNETVMLIPVRTETKYWHDYILFNKNVEIHWLKKGPRFINPQNNQPMGIFKNALALVFFNNGENKC